MPTETTDYDQTIFFHSRAHCNKATKKVSYFYHAPIFTYELNKKLHSLTFSEKPKWIKTFSHSALSYPLPLTCGAKVKSNPDHLDRGRAGGYTTKLAGSESTGDGEGTIVLPINTRIDLWV